MPCDRLRRANREALCMGSKEPLNRASLDDIVCFGGGTMGVDVFDLLGDDPGVSQGFFHCAVQSNSVRMRRYRMKGFTTPAVSDHFCIDLRITAKRVRKLLQN